MALAPGSRLGAYEILGLLGTGGMGEVYRAKDLRLGREVAIKVLPAEVASSPERLARFEREARVVAGLNHPNIVVLHSVEDADGVRFLTMELVEGQTLSTLVSPGGLPLPKLLKLTIPLTDALVAAHEKGVIHRDLKPGNVMVTPEGRVKVLDFGLAKFIGSSTSAPADTSATATAATTITAEGHLAGTVPYMAPELLRGEAADARADLFALGIMLYELVAGRRPFTGETSIDVSHAILHESPRPLSQVRTDLPADLENLVSWCLEKDPRERIQSALDANHELRRLQGQLIYEAPGASHQRKVASIAVLAFLNRSTSTDDEYFSDGLSEELLNVLSKVQGLRVTARASSFHFKGKDVPIAEIGKVLNVDTLLDGSVRKVGNRIRVSVQLVNATNSTHLWAETYDRTLEDIFAVQDDIAQSVVRELRKTLLGELADSRATTQIKTLVAMAAKGRSAKPEAHRVYLLAQHLINRATQDDVSKGIEHLKQALKLDPTFALAWAELSRAYEREVGRGWAPGPEGIARAREAAERALTLEPNLAEGHLALGRIQMSYEWDWRGAESSFARALELSPGNYRVLYAAGMLALCLGRSEEAILLHRRAVEQNPLSVGTYTVLGSIFCATGRLAEGEEACRMDLQLAPERPFTHGVLTEILIAQGRREEALVEALREPEVWVRLYSLALVHNAMGHKTEADAALRGLIEKYASVVPYRIAEIYANRGESDTAFAWLERAYVQRDSGLDGLKMSVHLRPIHGDPRWDSLMRRMGLEE